MSILDVSPDRVARFSQRVRASKFRRRRAPYAGSEHTIDGVRHDLEVHTVHYPADGVVSSTNYIASVKGLAFSADKYTAELAFKEH